MIFTASTPAFCRSRTRRTTSSVVSASRTEEPVVAGGRGDRRAGDEQARPGTTPSRSRRPDRQGHVVAAAGVASRRRAGQQQRAHVGRRPDEQPLDRARAGRCRGSRAATGSACGCGSRRTRAAARHRPGRGPRGSPPHRTAATVRGDDRFDPAVVTRTAPIVAASRPASAAATRAARKTAGSPSAPPASGRRHGGGRPIE